MAKMAPIQDWQTYPTERCERHATSATREERPQLTFSWLAAEHHFVIYDQIGGVPDAISLRNFRMVLYEQHFVDDTQIFELAFKVVVVAAIACGNNPDIHDLISYRVRTSLIRLPVIVDSLIAAVERRKTMGAAMAIDAA